MLSKNLTARIAVAVVAIPAILWISYQGGAWLFGMVLSFSLIALGEFLYNEKIKPTSVLFWLTAIAVVILLLSSMDFGAIDLKLPATPTVLILFFLISGMILATGKLSPPELFTRCSRLMWGVVYIGLLYPFVFAVGSGFDGRIAGVSGGDLLLFLFAVLWVGDTAAMWVGSSVGKYKLAPAVSPNKTVEGFIGGILGAVAVAFLMSSWRLHSIAFMDLLILAVGCSVFGQLGDLVESMWKRSLGIKDSSAIIPGHGGILDRFDSLLFAAPFMVYYISYFVV